MASEALHVLDVGDSQRPTLVLLHALGMGGWMWQPHLAVLAAHYHVLAPDLPGCAGSVAAGPFTMEKGYLRTPAANPVASVPIQVITLAPSSTWFCVCAVCWS